MKSSILGALLLCALVAACTNGQVTRPMIAQEPTPACGTDTKICPDGSFVSRVEPSCDFEACPAADSGYCDYGSPYRDYKADSPARCATIRYACPDGSESFSDHCGCGCTVNYTPPDLSNSKVTNN